MANVYIKTAEGGEDTSPAPTMAVALDNGTTSYWSTIANLLKELVLSTGFAWFLDEDTLATDSATKVASQQSIKAYVDSGTVTLTNKRITKRVASTTDDATAVIDSDSYDVYSLTAVANATEFTVTGTPTQGQTVLITFKDAGASKGLTWTGITALTNVTLPTDTTESKQHVVGIMYIGSTWWALAADEEA